MMNLQTKRSFTHATLLTLTALLPLASVACTGGDSFGQSEAALGTGGIGGTGGVGGTPIGPPNGGWAPPPVWLPRAFQVSAATTSSVTLTWNEHGGNGLTILYRQLYDLAGNLDGNAEVIHTFTSLPAGNTSYTDSNGLVRKMAIVPGGTWGYSPIQPDHMIRYDIMEIAAGYNDCEYFPGGPTCLSTSTNAFIPSAVAYGAGRLQVRMHVAQATSGASNLHVRAELTPYNTTWLDSTQNDFAVGSNITYDLVNTGVDNRSDINYVDLWTPDADGVCVDDLQLKVDDTTTFHKSFSPCQWVGNHGGEIFIPFTALRSSPEWQAYNPYQYKSSPLVTFIGFNAEGLTSYLDGQVGSQLRDPIPTPKSGNDAKLGAKTTLTRADSTHLHVQQHLVNLHVVWDGIDFGTVSADPSYDLVIHHADPVCANWCVKVENAQGNSTYTGWTDYILDVLSLGVVAAIHAGVNDRLENALSKVTHSLPNPEDFGYCFVPGKPKLNEAVAASSFSDDGTKIPFDEGSLTVCIYPTAG